MATKYIRSERHYQVPEASKLVGVPPSTLYRWIRDDLITAQTIAIGPRQYHLIPGGELRRVRDRLDVDPYAIGGRPGRSALARHTRRISRRATTSGG